MQVLEGKSIFIMLMSVKITFLGVLAVKYNKVHFRNFIIDLTLNLNLSQSQTIRGLKINVTLCFLQKF